MFTPAICTEVYPRIAIWTEVYPRIPASSLDYEL
jgi:hypothetical protein